MLLVIVGNIVTVTSSESDSHPLIAENALFLKVLFQFFSSVGSTLHFIFIVTVCPFNSKSVK